jgi:hypothetical protein
LGELGKERGVEKGKGTKESVMVTGEKFPGGVLS